MEDLVPTDDKIEWVVRRLRANRSKVPSVMKSEQLQGWLRGASKAEGAVEKAAEKAEESELGTATGADSEAEMET